MIPSPTPSPPPASLPAPLKAPGFGILNGHIYIMGGGDDTLPTRNGTYDYDIAADTWTSRAALPLPVYDPASAVLNGKVWLSGGGDPFTACGGQMADCGAAGRHPPAVPRPRP